MALPESWQLPAADDIDSDSLEYLFDRQKEHGADIPWVRMARESEPVARISPELIRLQGKMELLIGQLDLISNQLKSAHVELGFLKAQLADKDAQLEQLAGYRAKAAQAIISDVERRRLREQVVQLEAQLAAAPQVERSGAPLACAYARPPATSGRYSTAKSPSLPLMPLIYILMLCFAACLLATLAV